MLRVLVLVQNINSNKPISDEEKVNLRQYITRSYESLTTFNVLFRNKEQYFVGEKGSKEEQAISLLNGSFALRIFPNKADAAARIR